MRLRSYRALFSAVILVCSLPICSGAVYAEEPKPAVVEVLKVASDADLFDVAKLPRLRDFRCYLASSYDRLGGNYDWAMYERNDGDEAVIMDVDGPGAIVRTWTADGAGSVIKIYLDNAAEPVVNEDFTAFLRRLPLHSGQGNMLWKEKDAKPGVPFGDTSYYVIPFQKHCKVTLSPLSKAENVYYQVNYVLFDAPTSLPEFSKAGLEHSKASYETIEKGLNWDDAAELPGCQHAKGTMKLAPGQMETVFDQTGPLTIRRVNFSVKWPTGAEAGKCARESLLLRGYWDNDLEITDVPGRRIPSIKAPLAYFFMDFGAADEFRSALVSKHFERYSARFPMPVRQRAVLEVTNTSPLEIEEITYDIAYEPMAAWDPGLAYFNAKYHSENNTFGRERQNYGDDVMYLVNTDGAENYQILRAWGEGHYVGTCFALEHSEMSNHRAFVEADEAVFVDDDPKRTMWGTGTEDYLNDAWGLHRVMGTFSGNGSTWDTLVGYRFHLSDCIPFKNKIAFTMEHGSSNNCSGVYRSVAYYYLKDTGPNVAVDGLPPRDVKNYHK